MDFANRIIAQHEIMVAVEGAAQLASAAHEKTTAHKISLERAEDDNASGVIIAVYNVSRSWARNIHEVISICGVNVKAGLIFFKNKVFPNHAFT